MSDPLNIYLNEHLGGAQIAVQLLKAMRSEHDDPKFREFADTLLPEIEADDRTLRSIAEALDFSTSAVKETGGWLLEKMARLKLGHTGSTDFDMFESLELLALGICGKRCLWKALEAVASSDDRLKAFSFENLIGRAERQYATVELQRLFLARKVLPAKA